MAMVRSGGGILSRITLAVASFNCRFGSWPTRLKTSRDFWSALSRSHLTNAGITRLSAIMDIDLVDEPVLCLVVSDACGRQHDYYAERIPDDIRSETARSWLGLE